LEDKDDPGGKVLVHTKKPPAAEEEARDDPGDGERIYQLDGIEEAELHARVFRVEAGDDLGLGLGNVRRRPVELGSRGDGVGDDGEGEHRGDENENGRQIEEAAVSGGGLEHLLLDQLDCVGDGLKETEWSDAVRTTSDLNAADDPSLQPDIDQGAEPDKSENA